jgi:hypothetical protein
MYARVYHICTDVGLPADMLTTLNFPASWRNLLRNSRAFKELIYLGNILRMHYPGLSFKEVER